MNSLRSLRTCFSGPLMAAAGIAAALATSACSENRPFERESASAQTRLAVPTSMTPPISVRGIDGAPDEWKLSERVAESLRSRDIPASAASRSRSAFVLKGQMRQGAQKNGRSRVEVVWSLYDGVGKKVGEVTQMAAVPGGAFKTPNEGVVEAMADAAAESIAPLVPSSSVQLADGTETGERKGNDRAKMEDRDRVTAVGKMPANTGVSRNLLAPPPKREAKVETAPAKPGTRTAAAPPPAAKPQAVAPSTATPPASHYSATPPASATPANTSGDKKALTAVGRYEGASALSRNLFRPENDPSKPLPPPQRVKREEPPRLTATPAGDTRETPAREPMESEESLSLSAAPEPASDTGRRPGAPTRITRPQHAEAETPRADVPTPAERPRQIAEGPAPRKEEVAPERRPEARVAPKPEQYAERAARAGYQYWIQVGAHKDEAVSRAEWTKIQTAAGGLAANAGNRIQRADLGSRGVYYRVQIGPFASQGEAGQFCAQLKARNVDCFLAAPETTTASTRPSEVRPNEEPARKAAPPAAAPKPIAKPAEPKPVAKPTELKSVAKPVEPKPVAKPAEVKPVAKPVETKPAPAEKREAAMPKKPAEAEMPPPLPEQQPPRGASAEKPDAPISTAPGLPGVLD